MELDVESKWTFAGLEDGRLVNWNDKVYITGVRRDTTDNGQGRMELSELKKISSHPTEISRVRIEHPTDPNSYCEKNWMPILDMPYHFLRHADPVELVKVNCKDKSCKVIIKKPKLILDNELFLSKPLPIQSPYRLLPNRPISDC